MQVFKSDDREANLYYELDQEGNRIWIVELYDDHGLYARHRDYNADVIRYEAEQWTRKGLRPTTPREKDILRTFLDAWDRRTNSSHLDKS